MSFFSLEGCISVPQVQIEGKDFEGGVGGQRDAISSEIVPEKMHVGFEQSHVEVRDGSFDTHRDNGGETPKEAEGGEFEPGHCRSDRDCAFYQVCDVSLGLCFSNCTKGANCFEGDRCNTGSQRCVCEPQTCAAKGGFCSEATQLCIEKCTTDRECPAPMMCQNGRCSSHSSPDGGTDTKPPEPARRYQEGEDCSNQSILCAVGLFCVKTTEGPEVCLRLCQSDGECQGGSRCSPAILSNNRGVCGTLVKEGEACSTAKRALCDFGFYCIQGTCQRRSRVGVFDQCDSGHFCVPTSLVCVSFGASFGSLCLQPCKVGMANTCPTKQECLSPDGGPDGVCVHPCAIDQDACDHPFLRCNPVGANKRVCSPQGNTTVNIAGSPCGGPYGTCAAPATCQVLFSQSQIGMCALPCFNGACDHGMVCLSAYPGRPASCFQPCSGFGGTCPKGTYCTPAGGQWICAP